MELTIDKVSNMPMAHRDGVYFLNSRPNIGEIVEFLLLEAKNSKAILTALQDAIVTKLWMTIEEATPGEEDMICDVRYQDGTIGYARYNPSFGFMDDDGKEEVITHWKPAPRTENYPTSTQGQL